MVGVVSASGWNAGIELNPILHRTYQLSIHNMLVTFDVVRHDSVVHVRTAVRLYIVNQSLT